jgi:hypothetical protein
MSNMMYACSIYYKTNLPMLVVFNKTDVQPCEFAMNWMTDFDGFMEALDGISAESYLASMNRSLALVMDEFYQCLTSVGVSSAIGFGFERLPEFLEKTKKEFFEEYLPEVMRRRAEGNRAAQFSKDLLEDEPAPAEN